MKPTRPFPERARARRRALQALYQWQIGGGPMHRIISQFNEEQDMAIADGAYFSELLLGVEQHLDQLDAAIAPFIDREIDALIEAKTQGRTIVPLEILTSGRYIKLRIAIGTGKKLYDKRASLKKKDEERSIRREIKLG